MNFAFPFVLFQFVCEKNCFPPCLALSLCDIKEVFSLGLLVEIVDFVVGKKFSFCIAMKSICLIKSEGKQTNFLNFLGLIWLLGEGV